MLSFHRNLQLTDAFFYKLKSLLNRSTFSYCFLKQREFLLNVEIIFLLVLYSTFATNCEFLQLVSISFHQNHIELCLTTLKTTVGASIYSL